jgi:hypothetical protein
MMRDSLAPEIRDQYRYLMEAIGSDFFSRRYFFKAIAYYDSALAYASKAEDKERIQTNIESAFLNAAGEALKHGQTIKARDVLIECGKRRPRCQRCLQELKRLR